MNSPYSTPAPTPTEARPACEGQWPLFWALIDSPANFYLRVDAARFCGTCPLRDTCLPENIAAREEWAVAVAKELARPKSKPCEWCGKSMTLAVHGGRRKRYCSDTCGHLARKSKEIDNVPVEIRRAHAEFVRLRTTTPVDEIPDDVRAGERSYQKLRHIKRKARKAVA